VLTEMEDRLLAMCDEDFVTVSLAEKIISTWYANRISQPHVISMLHRLSKLKLIHWHFKVGSKHYFNNASVYSVVGNKHLTFKATKAGLSYLQDSSHGSSTI